MQNQIKPVCRVESFDPGHTNHHRTLGVQQFPRSSRLTSSQIGRRKRVAPSTSNMGDRKWKIIG